MGNASSNEAPLLPADASVSDSARASTRSWKSYSSDDGETLPSSVHGNLMRSQRRRDPMSVYEVVCVLGEGSMGSVAKVRKREHAKGGSARREFVLKERTGCCFQFLSFCKIRRMQDKLTPLASDTTPLTSHSDSTSTTARPENRKVLQHQTNSSLITYGTKRDNCYALKSIHLDRCTTEEYVKELRNEVAILKQLDHPNIVKAIETYDYHHRLFIVLELCSGGDLYTRDPYTEEQAAKIVSSLLSAVAYLHDHDIVHRDLKFENICFSSISPTADIKVIDFGLSQKYAKGAHLKDQVGTVYTMSPELLAGDYDEKTDVWSVGVIAFMLLSSSLPFYGRDRVQVIKKIISGKYSFSSRRWRKIDSDAKVFVRDLLESDPKKRPSADRALKLCWLDRDNSDTETDMMDAMDNVQANIQAFAGYSKLKKLALMVIAYKSTNEEIGNLRRMFCKFDKLQNGVISLQEFKDTLSEYYEYTDEEMEAMFRGIDIDGTGTVHYSEFLAATMESTGSIDEERLAEAFDRIDSDDSGYITIENLREFLGDEIPFEYLQEIIDEADILRDHRISYEEFLELWNGESDSKLADAKLAVKSKRRLDGSGHSFLSSLTSGEWTDSERENRSPSSTASDLGSGTLMLKERKKEMSVRGQWV